MVPLKLSPDTVVSNKNKNNNLMTENFKRAFKVRPNNRDNLASDNIVVDHIRKQSSSKFRKSQKSSNQTLKPPPSKFSKVIVKQRN